MDQVERIGRFEVLERIRSNSFSLSYRGRDPFDDRPVLIQLCVASDEAIRRRFLLAAEQAATLRHPHIASVLEFGSGDSKPYLVQEVFSDQNLGDVLASAVPLGVESKLSQLVQIARALQYAHQQGVLHRELRPASVLVRLDGEVKLTDFGIARLASAVAGLELGLDGESDVGRLVPELLVGLELDVRSDIYGFGVLAYELLTGRAPYSARAIAKLVPQILAADPQPVCRLWADCPPDLDRLVWRCLRRDPGRRFSSVRELRERLESIVPFSAAGDIFEEETTAVISDLQTVYIADLAEPPKKESQPRATPPRPAVVSPREPAAAAEGVSAVESAVELAPPSPPESFPFPAAAASAQALPRIAWRALARGAARGAERARIAVGSLGRETLGVPLAAPARTRMAITAAILLLTGVIGWSLVQGPEPAPAVPIQPPLETKSEGFNGVLTVDARPWAEVTRVVAADGRDLELPEDRYTPLTIELPPGDYEVVLSHPSRSQSERCRVEVLRASSHRCEKQITTVEVSDYFRQTGWWR